MKLFRLMILVTAAILIFSGCKLELDYVIEENGTVSTTYLIGSQAGSLPISSI